MNPLDRIAGDMNANGLINWTNDVNELINSINKLINPYKAVLDRYEDAHDIAVGDEEKENVDNIIMELDTVKNQLCAIRERGILIISSSAPESIGANTCGSPADFQKCSLNTGHDHRAIGIVKTRHTSS